MTDWIYPGTDATGAAHPFATRAEHSLRQPFSLNDYANAAEGPGAYSDNQWYKLESLKDQVNQMELLRKWRLSSLWRAFNTTAIAMRTGTGAVAESMTFKGLFDLEPTPEPVGLRQIWFPNNYTDTWSQSISFNHYADKIALHKYDDMVQAYLADGSIGLRNITRALLGESATVFQDILIRNAYLNTPRVNYVNGATDFSGITDAAAWHFDPLFARDMWMALSYENVPGAVNPMGNGAGMTIICVTTPSVIHDIQGQVGNEWYTLYMQTNPESLLRYEVGAYKNIRFIAHPRNVLWNCGDIRHRGTLTSDYGPGDGAYPNKIDGVYTVGQASGVQNYIEVSDVSGFTVGDIVTVHKTVTSDFGVADGVDYREATARRRKIVNIGAPGPALSVSFDRPLFHEFEIGDYVTLAEHIHPSVYIAGPQGVVTGVGDPIATRAMPPIDDAAAIYRFIWDGYFETQLFRPEVFQIVYSGGARPNSVAPVP